MLTKKINKIILLLSLSFSSAVMAQVIDSTLPRPNGGPTIGTKHSTNSSDLSTALPEKTTITEYIHEICPTGLTGPDGTNKIVVSQRHVTTYKLNGSVVGVSETDWEDIDQDCMGREFRNVACPVNQRGEHKEERQKITADNGTFDYTDWMTLKNTCAYYKIRDEFETRNQNCPAGQIGIIIERRDFESWSDGSKRNYTNWFLQENQCKPVPEGPIGQVIASVRSSGYPLGNLPGTSAPRELRLNVRNGTAFGLTIDRRSQTFQCLVAKHWSDGISQSNILPVGASIDFTGNDSMPNPSYCSLSNDGKYAEIGGNCNSTSGGDSDHCESGYYKAQITSVVGCDVTISIQRQYGQYTNRSYNICN